MEKETAAAARKDPITIDLEVPKQSLQHCLFNSFYKINIISKYTNTHTISFRLILILESCLANPSFLWGISGNTSYDDYRLIEN